MEISDQTKLVLNSCLELLNEHQFVEVLEILKSQSKFSYEAIPARAFIQKFRKIADPELKRRALDSFTTSNWGQTLIVESNSPELESYAQDIARRASKDEGRLGVSSLTFLARSAFKHGRAQEGWSHFVTAAQRADGVLIDVLKPILKLTKRHSDQITADRSVKVAILGSTTTHYLSESLILECAKIGLKVILYEGQHGAYRQEILDPSSGLYRFAPEIVIIWNHKDDFQVESEDDLLASANQMQELWSTLLGRNPCRVIQCVPDIVSSKYDGILNWSHAENGAIQIRQKLFQKMTTSAPQAVWFLDMLGVRLSGNGSIESWENASQWYSLQQSPGLSALRNVGASLRALIQNSLGLSKKLLILDLDNTLWGGVIGEDGLHGIGIGNDSPIGRAYFDFQVYLKKLKDRGVILAVCSKNNDEDARSPFLNIANMPLQLSDFVVFKANWRNKVDNIREIVQEINVGFDSVVFVDDNPLERLLVRNELPALSVPQMPTDPVYYIEAIENALYFPAYRVTNDDLERVSSYRANAEREVLKAQSSSIEDYLRDLEMRCAIRPLMEQNADRVYQLLHKTNQFNLTNNRHSEETLRGFMGNPDVDCMTFTLTDKFGSHGLIGVLIARAVPGESIEIDTWLMSCRVLGRKVEELMMDELVRLARKRGIKSIVGQYNKSKKNGLVENLLEDRGFNRMSVDSNLWVYKLKSSENIRCNVIAVENAL